VLQQKHDFLYVDIANNKLYRNFMLLTWDDDGSHQAESEEAKTGKKTPSAP
jgi:hypothetical protein